MASLPSLLSKHFICTGRRSLQLSAFSSLASSQSWSEEWRSLGLGARLPKPKSKMTNLLFVQMGFGVDQHGNDGSGGSGGGATKAAVRAVRNAIEFNSIPGAIEAIPGGRSEMLIKVKLGIPLKREEDSSEPMDVNLNDVAKVFPYGRLLPIEVVVGGLTFNTGRIGMTAVIEEMMMASTLCMTQKMVFDAKCFDEVRW